MSDSALWSHLALLVEARSVSSRDPDTDHDPAPGLSAMAGAWEQLGARVRLVPNPRRPGKPILVADLGPEGEPAAVLAGHFDTVPTEIDRWSGDPWTLRHDGHWWVGLGVADMKGFYAAAWDVVRAWGAPPERLLRVVATSDEESGMEGIQTLADEELLPPAPTILGEPTGGVAALGCKGVAVARARFHGAEGHASRLPERGLAVDAARRLLNALDDWRRELSGRYADRRFDPPAPTVNVGRLRGGNAFNRIATPVEVDVEVRLLPGFDPGGVFAELEAHVAAAAAASGTEGELERWYGVPPYVREAGPGEEELAVMPFATEAGYFPADASVTIWGPGELGEAHTADEGIDARALVGYRDRLNRWLRERLRP